MRQREFIVTAVMSTCVTIREIDFLFWLFRGCSDGRENNEQVTTMYSSHVRLSENLSHHLNSITQ